MNGEGKEDINLCLSYGRLSVYNQLCFTEF